MKCKICKGCYQKVIIKNDLYLYCFVCNKYFKYNVTGTDVIDVTKEIAEILDGKETKCE